MGLIELLILSVALSMDAFAVSICKGLSCKKVCLKEALICGIWFGSFQAIMPLLGFLLGSGFAGFIERFSGWVAFLILVILGGNMIREAFEEDEDDNPGLDFKTMLAAAVATSIDALAVGVTFVAIPVNVLGSSVTVNTIFAVCVIGIITLIISGTGVYIGGIFGTRYKKRAVIAGGVVLILIGIKSLIQTII
jgi:putative Mn2+ efflux pump MntP